MRDLVLEVVLSSWSGLTDNKKRTVSEIRHIFSKGMGNLGSVGCASRLFNYIGTVTVRDYSPFYLVTKRG